MKHHTFRFIAPAVLAAAGIVLAGAPPVKAAAPKKVLTTARYGMKETAPAGWGRAGRLTGIWSATVPIRAQVITAGEQKYGGKVTYSVKKPRQKGRLKKVDPVNRVYGKNLKAPKGKNIAYLVKAKRRRARGTIYRAPATCDNCHSSVKTHDLGSRCTACHGRSAPPPAEVLHKRHKDIASACTDCHADTFADADRHLLADSSRDCTFCHGDLSQPTAAAFLRPRCEDCHSDPDHAVPAGSDYGDATGHNGILCIVCHGPPHRVTLPTELGDGVNNNCVGCHTTRATGHNGPDCGTCHNSSWDPHLAQLP